MGVAEPEADADWVAPACEIVGLAPPQAARESAAAVVVTTVRTLKIDVRDFKKRCDACSISPLFSGARVFTYCLYDSYFDANVSRSWHLKCEKREEVVHIEKKAS
ncbi:hypothetical protein [Arthrobacter sp. efr-133-R2A-63]|uniref:hypothetical protein n=1 Tax=Arthrobacter sp. efr-133-R2A-63 TaxID=3040278 RepID=UPI00254A292E|nr:hypothetical protein [Arthrobacter sp. efr-133-R2A-63]